MSRLSSVAIIGVGLIGGSIGLALRQRRLAKEVVGIGRRATSLAAARRRRAVDRTTTDLAKGVAQAELIVVCTPVSQIAQHVIRAAAACPPGALITDAGSTKAQIVSEVRRQLASAPLRERDVAFVGSHPLAGDHRTGVEHARGDLLEGRTVVITPARASVRKTETQRLATFWTALGAEVSTMLPEMHDRLLAAASHVPHLVAAALAAATPRKAIPLTAGGWRDTTRIAASDPKLWRDIVASNCQQIVDSLTEVQDVLALLREAIEAEDFERLQRLLAKAKRVRDAV